MSHKRKAFNFDLDNGKLEELYPSPSGSTTSYKSLNLMYPFNLR